MLDGENSNVRTRREINSRRVAFNDLGLALIQRRSEGKVNRPGELIMLRQRITRILGGG